MQVPGNIYIISAPSGGGKTSLIRQLTQTLDHVQVSVSYTTRLPRPGEVEGVNYHFTDELTFQAMLNSGVFLEHAVVFGHHYGTSRIWVEETLQQGIDIILEIDWQGAAQIRQMLPQSVGIFIIPPSRAILEHRLHHRAQDSHEVINKRMAKASLEISHYPEYDYLVINENFEQALTELRSIFVAGRLTLAKQQERYHALLRDLVAY